MALSSFGRWVDEVIGVEPAGPLPTRIVLVPTEAHAHALRREVAVRAPHVLAGARFLTTGAAARAVLDAAGVAYEAGEEVRRPLRIRKVIRAGLALTLYRAEDLATRGWEEAVASSIDQLEAASLTPTDLDALDDPRARDLATIWRAVDADAASSWTLPRIAIEAGARAGVWPFSGPVLAAVTSGITTADARFVRRLPRVTLGVVTGRPARPALRERVRALFGDAAADAGERVHHQPRDGELGLLAELLFESPQRLGAPARRRSAGPDGTVSLERHAGVDEELDATTRWVMDEIVEHETPLREIAILVPRADPFAALVAARIRSLEWPADVEPVYVACGTPVVSTAPGARLLALLRALQDHLPADAVQALLPRLRIPGDDGHLTPGQARAVVDVLATSGGSQARPADALRWRDRLDALPEAVAAIRPAVESLVSLVEEMAANTSLAQIWESIEQFAEAHLIGPRALSALVQELGAEIAALAADPVTRGIGGIEAVELIAQRLEAIRTRPGRYGQPSIYVGTIAEAAGLAFSAVRVIGLAEGVFPGTLRDDAVFPQELRRRLPAYALPSAGDYAASRLQALARVVRDVSHRLALSSSRADVDGSEREPASLFLEAAAALARPNASTGAPARIVPTLAELDRDAFQLARAASDTRRTRTPLAAACWLARVAHGRDVIPSAWSRDAVTDPGEIAERARTMDGLLGAAPLAVTVFGLDETRPLSASAIRTLLACPHRFLLERMIGFRPRRRTAQPHRIDPDAYGKLVHRILDRFAREHGDAFGFREPDLERWLAAADALACEELAALAYPLVGDGAARSERHRLRRDVRTFIADDWDGGRPRRFVASEREFGPLALATATGPLYVRGTMDRIDIEGELTLVRDLKTGRARPRERDEADPAVMLDVQLAVYTAVARVLATEWKLPEDVAGAYAYVDGLAMVRERAFRDDRHALAGAGARWLDLAAGLIREQAYVRTQNANECRWCPFAPVCGDEAARTTERLREAGGALGAFLELET